MGGGGGLNACGRYNSTVISTPTSVDYFTYPNGSGGTAQRLWILDAGATLFSNCDLDASSTLGNCVAYGSGSYPANTAPNGIAAFATLSGGSSPTLFLSMGSAVNENCDVGGGTCTPMSFGYSKAVAVG